MFHLLWQTISAPCTGNASKTLPQLKISRVPAQKLCASLIKQLHHIIETSWWWRWGKIPLHWSRMAQMTQVYLWQLNCLFPFPHVHVTHTEIIHACRVSYVPYCYRTREDEPPNCKGIWYHQSCAQIPRHVHHKWKKLWHSWCHI